MSSDATDRYWAGQVQAHGPSALPGGNPFPEPEEPAGQPLGAPEAPPESLDEQGWTGEPDYALEPDYSTEGYDFQPDEDEPLDVEALVDEQLDQSWLGEHERDMAEQEAWQAEREQQRAAAAEVEQAQATEEFKSETAAAISQALGGRLSAREADETGLTQQVVEFMEQDLQGFAASALASGYTLDQVKAFAASNMDEWRRQALAQVRAERGTREELASLVRPRPAS
jgi:hypothetical protein